MKQQSEKFTQTLERDLGLNSRSTIFNMIDFHLEDNLSEPRFSSYITGKILPINQTGKPIYLPCSLSHLA